MIIFAPNACRGCASISDENKSLFYKSLPIAKTYPTKLATILAECLSVNIFSGDGYPTTICIRCETQLLALDTFKSSAIQIYKEHTKRIKNAECSSKKSDKKKKPTHVNKVIDHQQKLPDERLRRSVRSNKDTDSNSNDDKPNEVVNLEQQQQLDDEEDVMEIVDTFESIDPLVIEIQPIEDDEQLLKPMDIESRPSEKHDYANRPNALLDTFPRIKSPNRDLNTQNGIELTEYLCEMDAKHGSSDDAYVIDNRQSLPEAIETSTGVRCSFCKRGFTQRLFFEMHLCSNDGRTMFKCIKCDETLNNSEIQKHVLPTLQCKGIGLVKSKLVGDKLPRIPNANMIEGNQASDVEETEMPTNVFSLNDGSVVDNRRSLPDPIKLENGFQCEICKNCFMFRALFEMHLCKEDDGVPSFQCKRCEKPLNSTEAEDHLTQTTKCLSNDFALEDVSQSEEEADMDDEDVVDNRQSGAKPIRTNNTDWQCRVCKRRFLSLTFFKMHLCTKFGQPVFQCTNCEKKLHGPQIHQHLNQIPQCVKKQFRRKQRIQRTACDDCNGTFTVEAIKYHICSDAKPRRYKCNICGMETSLSFCFLKDHMFRHTEIRPLKCPDCPKSFKLPLDLRVHRLKHSTNLKFICDVCNHRCRNKTLLAEHMLSHSDECPFKCYICEKSFKMQKRLDLHIYLVHSGIRPHICDVCGKGFPKGYKLKVHMTIHNRKKANPTEG